MRRHMLLALVMAAALAACGGRPGPGGLQDFRGDCWSIESGRCDLFNQRRICDEMAGILASEYSSARQCRQECEDTAQGGGRMPEALPCGRFATEARDVCVTYCNRYFPE